VRPRSSGDLLRDVRDLVLWALGWGAFAVFGSGSTLSPQGNPIVFLGGGLVAGALVLLPPRRWWPVLVPTALGLAYIGWDLGWNWDVVVVRAIIAVAAILVYADAIRRHRQDASALGASLGWVLRGALRAVIVVLLPIAVMTLLEDGEEAELLRHALGELGFSTAAGLILGSGCVIAVASTRAQDWTPRVRLAFAGLALATVATLAIGYLTPLGTQVPAVQFAPYIFLFIVATTLPLAATALLVTVTALVIAVSAAREIGPYATLTADDTTSIVSVEVLILFLTMAFFSLAYTVSERRAAQTRAEAAAALMTATFEQSPTASALVDLAADGRPSTIRSANPAFARLVGGDLPVGTALDEALTPVDGPRSPGLVSGADVRVRVADGQVHWLRTSLSDPLDDPAGGGRFAVLSVEDVTADRTSEDLLRQQARRDPLTGLPNRQALVERLDETLTGASVAAPVALVIVDIDGLHDVNEGRGHDVGDQVVVEVGRRLSGRLPTGTTIARAGGDEFAIVRTGTDVNAATRLGEELSSIGSEPIDVEGQAMSVSVSVGVAVCDQEGGRGLDLLRHADLALARAKLAGRGRMTVFEPGDEQPAIERVDVEQCLRRALTERTLVCLFQPVVAAGSRKTVGGEALVRLRGVDGRLIPPGGFLPLAHDLGLMGALTDQVLDLACKAVRALQDDGHPTRISFNAPPHWLSPATADTILDTIRSHGVPEPSITVEVTEDETLSAGPQAIEALTLLRGAGVHVAIDDFGTGYAGLDTFRVLPADLIKVDRAFIVDMMRSDEDRALVRAMIDLIHRFGRSAVAEGVETAEQADLLAEMGCDLLQGFLFSRPVPLADFPAGLRLG
jgi:diguanylate cyclase (GGDEF)-like protein